MSLRPAERTKRQLASDMVQRVFEARQPADEHALSGTRLRLMRSRNFAASWMPIREPSLNSWLSRM